MTRRSRRTTPSAGFPRRLLGSRSTLPVAALLAVALTTPASAAPDQGGPDPKPVPREPGVSGSAQQPERAEAQAAQTLTWTADNSTTEYASVTTEATAGPATIVFENSRETGNTSGMQHTLTFDTSGGEYNDDVDLNILAQPDDEQNGRWTAEVVLTEGTYRFYCTIPGHGQMAGELVVTAGDGGPAEDTTPPQVTSSFSGETDAEGNYVGSTEISLDATDAGSGVESVEYQIDDTGWAPYDGPVTVDEVGDHTIRYRATDAAGNVSQEGVDQFSIVAGDGPDETAPEVEATVDGQTNPDGDYLGSATVSLAASDSQSGVASVEYALDDGAWQTYSDPFSVDTPGQHTVRYRATDEAGNVSEPGSTDLTVVQAPDDDTEPPAVSATMTGDQNADWAFVGSATLTVTATDDGSGVQRIQYRLDGGDWQTYEEPVTVDSPGEHTVRYRAVDAGGNVSEVARSRFTVIAAVPDPRCATPDPSPTVVVGDVGTGVHNRDARGSCTVDDLIRDEARWHSHSAFVVHARRTTADLRDTGHLDRRERNRIVRAARQSDVGDAR